MKRSELKVGGEYYYDRSNKWMEYTDGGRKAVVVDLGPFRITTGFASRRPYVPDPKGNAVLVEIHTGYGVITEAVPTARLRGPWESTKAEVDRLTVERRAALDQAREERTRRQAIRRATVESAAPLGIDAGMMHPRPFDVFVPAEEFSAMVEALAAAGWRYEPKGGAS